MAAVQKVTPFLWFNNNGEEAANFYVSLFKNSMIHSVSRYGEGGPMPKDLAMVVEFEIEGLRLSALNGGPHYTLNEAFSLMVTCDSQQEVDHFWEKLTANGGSESMCGWCKDRFGLSWQVIPTAFVELLRKGTPAQSQRVMNAMMTMRKFNIAELEAAFAAAR